MIVCGCKISHFKIQVVKLANSSTDALSLGLHDSVSENLGIKKISAALHFSRRFIHSSLLNAFF